jgi:MFS family permease
LLIDRHSTSSRRDYNPQRMGEGRLLTRAFVLGFAANFLHSLSLHSYLHLPGFLHGLGADELRIGIVMATMSLSAILLRPLIGRLIDERGRRIVVLVGGVVNILACLAYLTVETLGPWLYTIRIVHGLAQAMLFSVLFTIAADVVPAARRVEGIALFGISGMIPLSLAGLIGDAILARAEYEHLFVFTACAAAAGHAVGTALPDSRPLEGGDPARSFFRSVFAAQLLPVWVVGFGFSLAIASYFTFFKTWVIAREIGSVGGFFTAYTIAAVLLRVVFGWVPDRIGPKRTLVPALVCLSVGVGLLAFVDSEIGVIVAGALCGTGHGYAFPITSALVVTRARASERGAALAAFTALFDLGLLVGGPTLGLLVTLTDYETMFATAAVLVLVGLLAFIVWDRPRRGARST